MLRHTSFNFLRASTLAQRLNQVVRHRYQFNGKVKQCGARLVYHVAKQDPQLALLPASALVGTVNETLSMVADRVEKKSLTQSMVRELLHHSGEKMSKAKRLIKDFSDSSDRNVDFMVASRKRVQLLKDDNDFGDEGGGKSDADLTFELERIIQNLPKNKGGSKNKLSGKTLQKMTQKAREEEKRRAEERAMIEDEAMNGDKAIGKWSCFYDLLTRNWDLCRDVRPLEKRVCVIFHLISAHGYQESYAPEQIAAARATVDAKTRRYVATFRYAKSREFYCRRRLLTDGSLHTILSSGEAHDTRKVAWILFFDSSFQRFPRRPKKDPAHDLFELWHLWQSDPAARSLPFIERFIALLTHPDLDKMLKEAAKTADAKARAATERHTSFFEYRRRTAINLGTEPYNARKEIQRQGYDLNTIAWKLQNKRDQSLTLASLPTYFAVLETSQKYRSTSCARLLEKALSETSDDRFSYQQTEL